MTFLEFRSDSDRVKALREALEQPIMFEAMRCLEDNAPVNIGVMSDVSPTHASVRLGDILGYARYARTLKVLAMHTQPPSVDHLPSTYEPAEE